MTIKELKEVIKDLPDNMPVYAADHDHSEWETNGPVRFVDVVDQSKLDEYEHMLLKQNPEYKIKGRYLVLHL